MDQFSEAILAVLTEAVRSAVGENGEVPPLTAGMIERPPNPEMGDYAFPCFVLAKALRKGPPVIAQELAAGLVDAVAANPLLTEVAPVGPYVNFRVNPAVMVQQVIQGAMDGSYFAQAKAERPRKVMVEYSQPNTHKAFHVGHMRNVALGDALVRIMEYNGHEVVAVNYIGDSGAHIAKCLWYYTNHRPADSQPPEENRGEWLGEMYTAATLMIANAAPEERKQYETEISDVLRRLEGRDQELGPLWDETKQWSLDSFQEIYNWLGARFDHVFTESEMEAPGKAIVDQGLDQGVFIHSQGAVGADLDAHKLPFFLVLKGDGNTLYSTKDLALAQIKFREYGIEESIYVVGAEQTLHFRQVFKTLELLGYEQAKDCHHLAYGLVVLPDGKMSSRAGNVILFSSLRESLNDYIETNYLHAHRGEWPDAEIDEAGRRIAVAAIRYGMIKQDPTKQIVFNLEDWLVSEGDTGTYLCYAYSRAMSVLRKAEQAPDANVDFSLLTHEAELKLVRELYDFNAVAHQAAEKLLPNLVANALFQIAKEFSRTYRVCPVLKAETPELAQARLALFTATGLVLKTGLGLLGITPPERM